MNEEDVPVPPVEPSELPPPLPGFEPPAVKDESPGERKGWLSDLKAYFRGAVEDAREASQEKQVEMRAQYKQLTGHTKED